MTKQNKYRFIVAGIIEAVDKIDAQAQVAELLRTLKLFIIKIDAT